jgi:hypothetical protein
VRATRAQGRHGRTGAGGVPPERAGKAGAVLLIVLAVLTLGFITSLVPFMYPDTILNVLGVVLNGMLAQLIAEWVPSVNGIVVASSGGGPALTLIGVFAIYGLPLMLVLVALRNR